MTEFPYRDAAEVYRNLGWQGALPIGFLDRQGWAPRLKGRPPAGYTGAKWSGSYPSDRIIQLWRQNQGNLNIGLRLPDGILGIDVDQYGAKRGSDNLADFARKRGLEPLSRDTLWSSARGTSGIAGIYYYRTPEGRRWVGDVCDEVEVIQHAHRYTLVWPSIHPEGGLYQWYQGHEAIDPPSVEDERFLILPDEWAEALTVPEEVPAQHEPARPQVADRRYWHLDVLRAVMRYEARDKGSRHVSAANTLMLLARAELDGKAGATSAIEDLTARFVEDIRDRASEPDARDEVGRLVAGARERVQNTEDPRITRRREAEAELRELVGANVARIRAESRGVQR